MPQERRASGETVHVHLGMAQLASLSSFSDYSSYGTYLFPGISPFTRVGRNGRYGGRVELSGKVASSAVFTVEEKVKADLSQELSRALLP